MTKLTPKQTKEKKYSGLRNVFEYTEFIEWISLPTELREPSTQRELALQFKIGEDTLSDWKKRDGFWTDVENKRKSWGKDKTSDVLHSLYKKATKTGDPRAVRLWFEIVEDKRFNDKSAEQVCSECSLYRELDSMTNEELESLIKDEEKAFNKK